MKDSKMQVIWTAEKLKNFYYSGIDTSDEMGRKDVANSSLNGRSWVTSKSARLGETISNNTVVLHARASGDGACVPVVRCCRLCNCEQTLRSLGDSCAWEGALERYDQLLADCFGVTVSPSDGLICDHCINQLRNTRRFRALVYAAFVKCSSECGSLQTTIAVDDVQSCRSTKQSEQINETNQEPRSHLPDGIINNRDQTAVNKKILELLTKKSLIPKKQSLKNKSSSNYNAVSSKRTIVMCSVCGQRYPMIVPSDIASREFTCSRCKLRKNKERTVFCKKCNVTLPANAMREHVALHVKPDLRGRSRLSSLSKKPSLKNLSSVSARPAIQRRNYECNKCSKKYLNVKKFADHTKTVHGVNLECVCSVCGKDLKTRYLLDQHLRLHTGEKLFECDICKRVFKGKNALQLHYLTHDNFLPSNSN